MLFDGERGYPRAALDRAAGAARGLVRAPIRRRGSICREVLPFASWDELAEMRRRGAAEHGHEGVMLKLRTSPYVPGRPKGLWYKWKRDPNVVDAVLMYAQRGHGKRSSFYSDYTFGVWKGNEIVPIGKAYFGFTDEELKQLDKWVRNNTIAVVRAGARGAQGTGVRGGLRLGAAIDAGTNPAWRCAFPRINRIRWDKPAERGGDARRHAGLPGGHVNVADCHRAQDRRAAKADVQAAEAEDFETRRAAPQRDVELKGQGAKAETPVVRKPPPGQMGLGTHIPVAAPPKGWKRPKKPDPMTRSTTRSRPPGRR